MFVFFPLRLLFYNQTGTIGSAVVLLSTTVQPGDYGDNETVQQTVYDRGLGTLPPPRLLALT
jgi:hypothetical protein